jgi:hypothetical protein
MWEIWVTFYLPHIKFGKVLVSLPENIKTFLAIFHAIKIISVCSSALPLPLTNVCRDDISGLLRDRELEIWITLVI